MHNNQQLVTYGQITDIHTGKDRHILSVGFRLIPINFISTRGRDEPSRGLLLKIISMNDMFHYFAAHL